MLPIDQTFQYFVPIPSKIHSCRYQSLIYIKFTYIKVYITVTNMETVVLKHFTIRFQLLNNIKKHPDRVTILDQVPLQEFCKSQNMTTPQIWST